MKDIDFINQLNNIVKNNNKVIAALESGKKVNIEKSVKAALLSNNVLTTIMINYITQYGYFEEDSKGESINDKAVDNLFNIFGINK